MRIVSVFQRHSWFAARADAFADGELPPADVRRFESHLAACDACAIAVRDARQLRAAVAGLPEVTVPRPFRLTPAMVASAAPKPVRQAGTPLYLGLARAGAALSVAAFAMVLGVGAMTSNESGNDESRAAPASAEFQAGGASENAATSASDKSAPAATPPALAPASSGGVSGSSLATPTLVSANPFVPTVSAATPVANADDAARSSAEAPGDGGGLSSVGYDASGAESPSAGDSSNRLPLAFGALALAMVVVLAALEGARRVRRA